MARQSDGTQSLTVTLPTGVDTSASFTAGCWFRRDTLVDARGIFATGLADNDSARGFNVISRASANLELRWGGGIGIGPGAATIAEDTWYRVGVTYNATGAQIRLVLDGTHVASNNGDAVGALTTGDVLGYMVPGAGLCDGGLIGGIAGAFWLQGVTLSAADVDTYLQDLCSLITDYGPSGGVTANALKALYLFQNADPGEDISGVGNDLTNNSTTDLTDPSGIPTSCGGGGGGATTAAKVTQNLTNSKETDMRVIPSNTATAALRRIPFTLVDATDGVTPEDISVTSVKVALSIDGGTSANSTNDIVKVDGATGRYYLELTQSEANQTAGAVVFGRLAPSGCWPREIAAQIGPSGSFADTVTLADGGITAAKFAAGAIDAAAIADNAIDAGAIATGAITSAKFAAGAINAAAIADGAIDAATFADNAITAAKIATDAITAAKIASDAVTEIQSGLATAANLATVAGYLDTEIAALVSDLAAVKAKTDQLAFTVAGHVDANALRINGGGVTGNGTSGNLWRGTGS